MENAVKKKRTNKRNQIFFLKKKVNSSKLTLSFDCVFSSDSCFVDGSVCVSPVDGGPRGRERERLREIEIDRERERERERDARDGE